MSDPTPWIVVEQSPARGCPAGVYRCRCLRCGDTNDIELPLPVPDLLDRMGKFEKRHRKCEEVSGE